jgi:hypothetical protein
VALRLTGPFAMTVLIARDPRTGAEKSVELVTDRDGDGQAGHGDVLRYTVALHGFGGDQFADDPGPAGRLIPGTVVTTRGTVTTGNGPDDTAVLVSSLGLTGADTATVTFDVEATPALANQGRFLVAPVTSDGRLATRVHLTDDPATTAVGDPTVTPLTCGPGPLGSDTDLDGVIAALDLCPTTPPGPAVDDRGCTRAEFCGRIDLFQPRGLDLCRAADWRNDETLLPNPGDCRPSPADICKPE